MATITEVTLNIDKGATLATRKVTIGYKIDFTAGEAGLKYSLSIDLFGYDGSKDPNNEQAPKPSVLLIRIPFASSIPGITVPFTTIIAKPGTYSPPPIVREIPTAVLDEDPPELTGGNPNSIPPIPPFPLQQPDEIYAVVTLIASKRQSALFTYS